MEPVKERRQVRGDEGEGWDADTGFIGLLNLDLENQNNFRGKKSPPLLIVMLKRKKN